MLASSARLLRLLSLLQSRPTWAGGDLVSRLEVTSRTLRRDVDRLRSLGYPVHSTSGPAGGYQLGAGASLPPLMLDNDEGLAVAVALHGASSDVRGVADAGQRALAKIDQVLPARLRRRLEALRASIVRVSDASPKVELGIVDTLAAACAERRVVRIGYRDQAGQPSRRAVEPHQLVLVGHRWYLAAWDQDRRDWRTFRVDRIEPPVELGAAFTPRPLPDDDAAAYVTRSVSSGAYRLQARVVLHVPVAVAQAAIPSRYGTLTALGANRCRLVTGASSPDGIVLWLGLSGFPFTVEEPPELSRRVRELAERLRDPAAPRAPLTLTQVGPRRGAAAPPPPARNRPGSRARGRTARAPRKRPAAPTPAPRRRRSRSAGP
jgi:predicted DNA-binding transcriptional regulator YafY